jgi:hypothetical protein
MYLVVEDGTWIPVPGPTLDSTAPSPDDPNSGGPAISIACGALRWINEIDDSSGQATFVPDVALSWLGLKYFTDIDGTATATGGIFRSEIVWDADGYPVPLPAVKVLDLPVKLQSDETYNIDCTGHDWSPNGSTAVIGNYIVNPPPDVTSPVCLPVLERQPSAGFHFDFGYLGGNHS